MTTASSTRRRVDREAVLALVRQGGNSHNAIARRVGCSSTHVGRIARAAGYTRGKRRIVGASGADQNPQAHAREVSHGDPRWYAWLAYWRTTDEATLAEQLRRQRRAVTVQQDWPPETPAPDVERLPLGTWSISHGTPESAAWLCVLRGSDPNAAQSADMAKRTLSRPTRWPLLVAPGDSAGAEPAAGRAAQEIAR